MALLKVKRFLPKNIRNYQLAVKGESESRPTANMAVFEMKELLRRKILHTAQCIEEGRTSNLSSDIEGVVSMACQLSSITNIDESLNILECILSMLPEIRDSKEVRTFSRPNLVPGHTGRPNFHIPIDVLEFLLDSRFKVQDIADMLGVGKRTIERRLQQIEEATLETIGNVYNEHISMFEATGYTKILTLDNKDEAIKALKAFYLLYRPMALINQFMEEGRISTPWLSMDTGVEDIVELNMGHLCQALLGCPKLLTSMNSGSIQFDNKSSNLPTVNTCAPSITFSKTEELQNYCTFQEVLLNVIVGAYDFGIA